MSEHHVAKKVLLELCKLDHLEFTKNNWVSTAKHVFSNQGISLEHIDRFDDAKKFDMFVKNHLYDNFENHCMQQITKLPVLRTYCLFKKEFGMDTYLKAIKNYSIRSCMSKLRLSSHCLKIETGRHTKPKLDIKDRLCTHCNQGKLEDEKHLIFECSLYVNLRSQLFSKCIEIDPSFKEQPLNEKLSFIMSDDKIVFYTGLFLKKCLNMRSKNM